MINKIFLKSVIFIDPGTAAKSKQQTITMNHKTSIIKSCLSSTRCVAFSTLHRQP